MTRGLFSIGGVWFCAMSMVGHGHNTRTQAPSVKPRPAVRRVARAIGSSADASATAAQPQGRIYWANFLGGGAPFAGSISWANLDGSGGGTLNTSGAPMFGPMGLTIDSATGQIFWSNFGNEPETPGTLGTGTSIGFANLDDSGGGGQFTTNAPLRGPHGLAFDPAKNRLYWPNDSTTPQSISYADLNGQGGTLNTTGATVDGPRSLAIDPSAGKLYYANHDGNALSYAKLDNSGATDLPAMPDTIDEPEGIAFDPSNGRMYFSNYAEPNDANPAKINTYGPAGGAGSILSTSPVSPVGPHGVAVDAAIGKVFWADFSSNTISYANLSGGGGGNLPVGSADMGSPTLPVLLIAPTPSGISIAGKPSPGAKLNCAAKWAADQLSSLLYRAPQSTADSWQRDGKAYGSSDTVKAAGIGEYRCTESARNASGTTSQSTALAVFKVGRPKLDRANGTATIKVKVPDSGTISLKGHGVHKTHRVAVSQASGSVARKIHAGKTKLKIRPVGKAKRKLQRRGRAKVKVTIAYKASGVSAAIQTKKVTLRDLGR